MRISNKRKILIYYVFCLVIIALGWFFLIENGRRNLIEKEKIAGLREKIENERKFYLEVEINESMEIGNKENLRKLINSVFSNPKLASIFRSILIFFIKVYIDPLKVFFKNQEKIEENYLKIRNK